MSQGGLPGGGSLERPRLAGASRHNGRGRRVRSPPWLWAFTCFMGEGEATRKWNEENVQLFMNPEFTNKTLAGPTPQQMLPHTLPLATITPI